MKNLIIAVLLIAGATGLILWSKQKSETAFDKTGTPIVDVRLAELDELQTQGKELFDANCAGCHGVNATGKEGFAPPLVHIIYETSHHGDASFYIAVSRGVRSHHWPFGDMPALDGVSEDEVTKIIAYVRALQRENGIF